MLKDFAFSFLIAALRGNSLIVASLAKVYAFGSVFWKTRAISDIDLLVVYEKGVDLRGIKRQLDAIDRVVPLDVTYMTTAEEKELDFLAEQRAVDIFEARPTIGYTRTPNFPLRVEFASCELP
ncbi:nucleotidyltransferase domain-containing protein [Methylocaldum sp. 14B]|uniref:nucleotidyltransferase domain-containing protein n=1 Tax=Methylocaldum sp. 14B TaxID=1912213 RepID=UPI00098A052A|nr:nucleotidyltransferase domain-containing protein [Methylocaldum sp. 14B]